MNLYDAIDAAVMRDETVHRITWFGVSDGERIPRNRYMNGRDWGWDATCSCGWDSRTGGAIQERVREAIADHKRDAASPPSTLPPFVSPDGCDHQGAPNGACTQCCPCLECGIERWHSRFDD